MFKQFLINIFHKKISPFGASFKSNYSKMVGTYDTEEQELLTELNTSRSVKLEIHGATFINRHGVAKKVYRSIQFIIDWWEKQ